MNQERIIKKYPNRRLYDTTISAYITLEDIRQLVLEGASFRVIDIKTQEDITRTLLLQVILEQEARGTPLFSRDLLEQFIRAYGGVFQGVMTAYLEHSMALCRSQQRLLDEQMRGLIETGPVAVLNDIARQHLSLWRSMQETALRQYGLPTVQKESFQGQDESADLNRESVHGGAMPPQ